MRAVSRVAGGLLVVVLAVWLALVEVFWLPLRVSGVPVPVSVVAAVVGNLLLVALAARLTGSRLAAALPAVVWLVVAVGASLRRPEGDLLLTGGGVLGVLSLAFLLAGVVAAAFAVGKVLAAPRGGVSPARTGSGCGGAR
jgi:hypothetical protein